MSRRLKTVAAGLVVTGSLAGAALAQAATSTTPTTPTTPSSPPAGQVAPEGAHHGKGNCPGMGGDSSSSYGSPSSSGTGQV